MKKRRISDTEELLERASADQVAEKVRQERRYIFNGDPLPPYPGYAIRPNKRVVRRKVSTFNIILLLFGLSISSVAYISNFLMVNQLVMEIGQLDTRYKEIVNANAALQAEINRKSAWERIGTIASEELGLRHPTEQPTWFETDDEKLEKVREK